MGGEMQTTLMTAAEMEQFAAKQLRSSLSRDEDRSNRVYSFGEDSLAREDRRPFTARATQDSLNIYMKEMGKISLLTPAKEAEIGRRIEGGQARLLQTMVAVPFARHLLLRLSAKVRRGQVSPNELIVFPDGRDVTPDDVDAILSRLDEVRKLHRHAIKLQRQVRQREGVSAGWTDPDIARTQMTIRDIVADIPLNPELIRTLLAHVRDLGSEMERLTTSGTKRASKVMTLLCKRETQAGLPRQQFLRLLAELEEIDEVVKEAKHQLLQANLRLVVAVARRYLGRGHPLSELVQEGNIGLMKAIDRFQYRRGFKFSTYAIWWIRHEILRGIAHHARTIRIPVYMLERLHRMMRVNREVVNELGREPTTEELAERDGISPEEVRLILDGSKKPVSLETPTVEDLTIGDCLRDENVSSPDDVLLGQDLSTHVARALNGLSPREKEIIRSRFGLEGRTEQTLEDLATRFSVTRERIRQIEAAALGKLRTCMAGEALRTFVEN